MENQEKKVPSIYMKAVMAALIPQGMAISKMLGNLIPPRLALDEIAKEKAEISLKFDEEGFGFQAKNLIISLPEEFGESTEVDGFLALGMFLVHHGEYLLMEYQAEKVCQEIEKMVEAGTIEIDLEKGISPAMLTLVMQNASVAAHDEQKETRPAGETLQ